MAVKMRDLSEERRASIHRAIASKPITFPYADLDALRKVTPLDVRYDLAMDILSEDYLESLGLDRDHIPELLLCRYQAAKYISKVLQDKGIPFVDAADLTQLHKSYFSFFARGERPLALEAEALVPLCYSMLHESCHKVMFGELGSIVLPGIYSVIVNRYMQLDKETKDRILENADELRKKFELVHPTTAGPGMHREPGELIRDRLWQIAYARGKNIENFFEDKQPRRIRNSIRAYFEGTPLREPRMSFTIFVAFETRFALDYFIVEDFTTYVPCFVNDGDKIIEIKDRQTLRFVGDLFAVDQATSSKMSAEVIAATLE